MKSRLEKIPRYQTEHTAVDASLMNLIKLAQLRLGSPIKLTIESLQKIEVILDSEFWVCLDASLNDMPLFAWIDFQTEGRSDLHSPIDCKLYRYHAQADLIIDTVTDEIRNQLDGRLKGERK